MFVIQDEESLQKEVVGEKVVIVQFGAESCNPCKAIKNKIECWNKEHQNIEYIYVPTEESQEMCGQMGIFTVPTIFVYVAGKLTLRESGYFSLTDILKKAEQYSSMICE